MQEIPLPAHSVVLIVGGRRAPLARLADMIPNSVAAPWDVMKPDASLEILHRALETPGIQRVCMKHSHAKGRRTVASAAHKRGHRAICIRLPGAPEFPDFDPIEEKHDAVYDVADIDAVSFRIVPMPSHRMDLTGPFDIIGDVHGCREELLDLLVLLGHADEGRNPVRHPEGRIPVLLGDLTDRGPDSRGALETARRISDLGGLVVIGNHDEKLMRWLLGRDVDIRGGIDTTIAELKDTSPEWRADMVKWLRSLEYHLMLDGGRLAVAHAGIDESRQGRHTPGSKAFALYGKPAPGNPDGTPRLDEDGYPEREDWALEYAGRAVVVHGHVPYPEPREMNGVVAIDTGCVYGGRLTAYSWPERKFVSVPAREAYYVRPVLMDTEE